MINRQQTQLPVIKHAQNIHGLSDRESEVLKLVVMGFSNKEIARKLQIGIRSVETYRLRAFHKLNLRTKADAVRYAINEGWFSTPPSD